MIHRGLRHPPRIMSSDVGAAIVTIQLLPLRAHLMGTGFGDGLHWSCCARWAQSDVVEQRRGQPSYILQTVSDVLRPMSDILQTVSDILQSMSDILQQCKHATV